VSRIVAGTYGGRRLATPPGEDTRPTSDRVREAMFSSGEYQENLRPGTVDLFPLLGDLLWSALSPNGLDRRLHHCFYGAATSIELMLHINP